MNTINKDMLPILKRREKINNRLEIAMAVLFGVVLIMWINILFTIFG